MPLLSAQALWAISLVPLALVAFFVLGSLVGGAYQARHRAGARPVAEVAYWQAMREEQDRRLQLGGARLGTPEPKQPVPATIWLPSATLAEAREYLREAIATRARQHREFLSLIGGLRA